MACQCQGPVQTGKHDLLKESHCASSSSRDGASSTMEGDDFKPPGVVSQAYLIAQVRCVLDMFGQASVQDIVEHLVLIKTRSAEELDLVVRMFVCGALAEPCTLDTCALYADVFATWKAHYLELPDQEGDARTLQRILLHILHDEYKLLRMDIGCDFVVTVQSTMLELGNWALTCTTVSGATLLAGLVMPSDFRYEDVQEILANDKGIPSFRVKMVSRDGEPLTENSEERLINLMMLIDSLFERRLIAMNVIGFVIVDLIGIRDVLPSEEEFLSAFVLCGMIGPCLDATVNGKKLMTEIVLRFKELQQFRDFTGELFFPYGMRMRIQELLDLRERDWQ